MTNQLFYKVFELIVDWSIFKFIFFFTIKQNAMLVKKAHYRSFPSWRPQKIYYYIKKPIVFTFFLILFNGSHPNLFYYY